MPAPDLLPDQEPADEYPSPESVNEREPAQWWVFFLVAGMLGTSFLVAWWFMIRAGR